MRCRGRVGLARLWMRWFACAVCGGMTVLAFAAAPSLAEEASSAGSLSGGPLAVEGALTSSTEQAVEEAALASPEVQAQIMASATAYEGMSGAAAEKLLGETFPNVVDEPAGGMPALPEGVQVKQFVSDYAASLGLPDGRSAVLDSPVPVAVDTSSGRVPVGLSVSEAAGGFRVAAPAVAVRVPARLGEGVALSDLGVSLTPLAGEHGPPLESEKPVVDGASVFYGGSEDAQAGVRDMSTLVKPTAVGIELSSALLSARSPERLFYVVGLPEGAVLRQQQDGSVSVIEAGQAVADIPLPRAFDAEGKAVSLSVSVSGDVLVVDVPHVAGEYRAPVIVDPTVTDKVLRLSNKSASGDWVFGASSEAFVAEYFKAEGLEIGVIGKYLAGQYGELEYPTQKESRIYAFIAKTLPGTRDFSSLPSEIEGDVYIRGGKGIENLGGNAVKFSSNLEATTTLCVVEGCGAAPVTAENEANGAFMELYAAASGAVTTGAALTSASVEIVQEKGPSASLDTVDQSFGAAPNGGYPGRWAKASEGRVGLIVNDPGIGVYRFSIGSPQASGWGHAAAAVEGCEGVQCDECWNYASKCESGHSTSGEPLTYGLSGLPDGKDTVEAKTENATGESATVTGTVRVDSTAPHGVGVSGLPSNKEIGEGTYHFRAEASDGEGSVESSGIASIAVAVDGQALAGPSASCSPGPCTAGGEWAVSGSALGIGSHTMTVTATDGAGNVASSSFALTVHRASPVSVGPGTLYPQSGEFVLQATDVALDRGLSVSRSYASRHLNGGVQGPLGTQWGFSMGGEESLVKQPNGSMSLTSSSGMPETFASNGKGGFSAPVGDANLTLSEVERSGVKEFVLKNAATATSTSFRVPTGASSSVWMPSISEGVVATETVTYAFEAAEVEPYKKVTRATEALAPVPSGVSCSPELKLGCRALTFNYASSTTAIGEASSEWGDYKGNLTRVYYTAYDPASKAMKTVEVAHYLYDKQGRLRAEWDPRVSPALKTTYGYDGEGHVTALTPPGQETWAFTYGSTAADPGAGRLVKLRRAPAAAELWKGELPSNVEAPRITGSAVVGAGLAVSTGKWSGGPVSYAYEWEDCNGAGGECQPIAGAINPNYTVASGDVGHTVLARVRATNGGGSVEAASGATGVVVSNQISEYSVPAGSTPYAITSGPDGDLWFVESLASKIGKMTTSGAVTEYTLASGSYFGITSGPDNNLWFTNWGSNKIAKITTSGVVTEYVLPSGSGPFGIVTGPDGNLWFAENSSSRIGKITTSGVVTEYSLPAKSEPSSIASGPDGNLWFTDQGSSRIGKITTSGAVTEYSLPEASSPSGIARGSDNNLWFTDKKTSRVGKITTSGVVTEYALPSASEPFRIASGSDNNLWFTETGTNRIGKITTSGAITEDQLPTGSQPLGIASGPDQNVWFTDWGTHKIGSVLLNPPKGESVAPAPGETIEYNVPLSGSGLPTMTKTEVERWAQKDVPTEATAIFPPDEPQGWPASGYKRATIHYLDELERNVDTATPGGAVYTAEYNATNDVVRTLSADNRAAALREGSKSAESAQLLDTQSSYNSEGTELLSTLGPQHTVRLANGKEVAARSHTVYSYDEGAPTEGGPYRLATKTTEGAQICAKVAAGAGKYTNNTCTSAGTGEYELEPEADVRTTTISYAAQNGLGWKLRKPTLVVTDPNGLKLKHVTVYDPVSGLPVETQPPAGAHAFTTFSSEFFTATVGQRDLAMNSAGDVYVTESQKNEIEEFDSKGTRIRKWGGYGTENGKFEDPQGIFVDAKGNVYVTDSTKGRVEEFNGEGGFIKAFGSNGSGAGQLWSPEGLVVDSAGNTFVADYQNSRIEEFNAEGAYVRTIGSPGSGNGQLSDPSDVAINAKGNLEVADTANERIEEFSPTGEYKSQFGSRGTGDGQFERPVRLREGPEGDLWVIDAERGRIQVFLPNGEFKEGFGKKGNGQEEFFNPQGVGFYGSSAYVLDAGNARVQIWTLPSTSTSPGNLGAHDTQIVYYTPGTEASVPACQSHPEWATLACQTKPARQPEVSGLPSLPVTTVVYNMWDEPTTATSAVGGETRKTTVTYDEAGRTLSAETTSTTGTAIPVVSDKYSAATGALVEQTGTIEGKAQTISSAFNTLGQLTSYTDADASTTTYEYEPENDVRLTHVNDGKGTQTYKYDETTGLVKELADSAAGTFTATRDVEGNITSERYPNNMSVNDTFDATGQQTSLQYVKNAHCAGTCPETWYSDSIVPSIHGQWLKQTGSLASQSYVYDNAGRLVEGQTTPAGKGCTVRVYAYDEETNRTSMTIRQPGAEGKCATEGGTIEKHTYDSANRLVDAGVAYDAFGNTTKLPAADAGGSELTSSFYANNELASQTQAGQTVGDQLDPSGRVRETVSTGKITATEVNHYAGPDDTPSWTGELSTNWTRYITGIGGLAAIQHNGEAPVLQVANLHGDIVATATDSESAISLASTVSEASEYGVPATEAPAKYSWLGAHQLPTTLPSGVIAMGARSYVPQLGRFLQTDPVPGGSANAYAYTYGDPVNSYDPTGAYTAELSPFAMEGGQQVANEGVAKRQSEEAAAREEAERKATEAETQAGYSFGLEEEEEWEEEEGEEYWEEYAAFGPGPGAGKVEAHVEDGVLYQSLQEEAYGQQIPPAISNLAAACHRELQSTGVSKPHGVCARLVDLCHSKFGGCGRLVKEGKPVRSSRRATSFCARLHDCPFPEPSDLVPVRYAVRKIVQAGKVIIEILVLE